MSLHIRRIQSPQTLSLSSQLLKEKPFKSFIPVYCQGALTSNKVPRKSDFASFLRKSCFLQISYQEFQGVAESLSFCPWGIPSWRLHAGAPEQPLTSHRQDCALSCPHLKVQTQGEGGRVTIPCVMVQHMRLKPSCSAWQTPTGGQDRAQGTSTGKTPSGLLGMSQNHIAPADILKMAIGVFFWGRA